MRCKPVLLLCGFVSVLLSSLPAHADLIDNFTLVGDGHTVTWSLPDGVLIPQSGVYNYFFESAPGTIDGISGYTVGGIYTVVLRYPNAVYLYLPETLYGVSFLPLVGPLITRPQYVYVNDPAAPIRQYVVANFNPGTYALQYYPDGYPPPGPHVDFTLTISQETAATPEPSSLLLLATGALGLGWFSLRRAHLPAGWLSLSCNHPADRRM